MTSQEIEAAKAAFLAKGGQVTQATAGTAYGVDPEHDKRTRAENRNGPLDWEQRHERWVEGVREAHHMGGRRAALEAMGI
jgi:hypothetical protein